MKRTIIVTRAEADSAFTDRGELPYQHLVRRFRDDCGLDVTAEELESGKDFKYESEIEGRAFRVTYTGEKNAG